MATRPTPKVSPLRGMPVEAWVKAKANGWQNEVVMRLLAMARKVAPRAAVSIKWGQPVIEENGPVAFIKVAKAHVTFGFWRGADLTDSKGVLEGGERMKHAKITSLGALDEKTLSVLLREALVLNRKEGDPTRRR
jgi:hypothetical protein